jgi:RHS repeat-associated protein
LKTFDRGNLGGTPKKKEQDWTLDQLGNWPGFVAKTEGTTDLDQTRDHNQVNEVGTIGANSGTPNWFDPVHDAAGNMTEMPQPAAPTSKFTLTYDAWNRLVKVETAAPATVQTNEYDGLGRRIVRVDSAASATYDYYYNENWQLLEERKGGSANPLNQYVWHPYYIDALAIRWYDPEVDGSSTDYYSLYDANFNVTTIVNSGGTVQERYSYTPYGEVTILDANFATDSDGLSDIGQTHLYTGRERDPETGLQLNRSRWYAAWMGRWVSRDPKEADINLYLYCRDNPIIYLDLEGLDVLKYDYVDGYRVEYGVATQNVVVPPWLFGGSGPWGQPASRTSGSFSFEWGARTTVNLIGGNVCNTINLGLLGTPSSGYIRASARLPKGCYDVSWSWEVSSSGNSIGGSARVLDSKGDAVLEATLMKPGFHDAGGETTRVIGSGDWVKIAIYDPSLSRTVNAGSDGKQSHSSTSGYIRIFQIKKVETK